MSYVDRAPALRVASNCQAHTHTHTHRPLSAWRRRQPKSQGQDAGAIKPKLKACAELILKKCPASHRAPVDRFFALDV